MNKMTELELNPVLKTMVERKSVRQFLADPVSQDDIKTILKAASSAPSGSNIQPWHVQVVSGAKREALAADMMQAFNNKHREEAEYKYYPRRLSEPYLTRRRENGWGLYGTLGIQKGDLAAMKAQQVQNFNFFGAPVALFILIDKEMELGSWIDTGTFIQNILLAAESLGLSTCPQGALMHYPSIVHKHLNYPENLKIVCAISIGYEDKNHIVNTFRTPRIELDEFTTFHWDE
ncbi:nitroreductase [Oligella urethralis]|uniref:Nitroreductase n=1 Tax=Oligella urethralis DNF00040 TaxID=1401065 RepID=A0A095YWX1_9BURK|nr:nitroreductase [Oligella urethralis]KGF26925.1 nitroreductase [Oligella urethralis DNF00040]